MNRPMNTQSQKTKRNRHSVRLGATLIDVAVGSMLLTILLIPSMRLIGETQSVNRRLRDRDTMLFEAEQLVETIKIKASEPKSFDDLLSRPMDEVSKITVADSPTLLARVQVSPDKSLPSTKLLTIVVDVWRDSNGDTRFDIDEPGQTLRTQWAAP